MCMYVCAISLCACMSSTYVCLSCMCASVCACMCACVCMHVGMHACTSTYGCANVHTGIRGIRVHIAFVCIFVCAHDCTCTGAGVSVCACM